MSVTPNPPGPSVDVAISFAAEDLRVAEEIARRLKRRHVRTYYYIDSPEATQGQELVEALQNIYGAARIVVVLSSVHYSRSSTAMIELDAAQKGASAESGIVVVRIDDVPVPDCLEGRTWYDLNNGTEPLLQIILRLLGRRRLAPAMFLLLGVGATCLLALFFLFLLGFRRWDHWPDSFFLGSALLPTLGVLITDTLPRVRTQFRIRRGSLKPLLQTTLGRYAEFARPYLAALFGILILLATAGGVRIAQQAKAEASVRAQISRNLKADYKEYYNVLTMVSVEATQSAVSFWPFDPKASEAQQQEYRDEVRQLKQKGDSLRHLLNNPLVGPSEHAKLIATKSVDLEQNADRLLGYQIDKLAAPQATYQSEQDFRQKRAGLAKLVIENYGKLFTTQMLELDDAVAKLDAAISEQNQTFFSRWGGVVSESVPP